MAVDFTYRGEKVARETVAELEAVVSVWDRMSLPTTAEAVDYAWHLDRLAHALSNAAWDVRRGAAENDDAKSFPVLAPYIPWKDRS